MASKLDPYRDIILNKSKPDREIAQDAGVTMGAVRAFRNRAAAEAKNDKQQDLLEAAKAATKPEAVEAAPKPEAAKAPKAKPAKAPKAKPAKAPKRTKVEAKEGVLKTCPNCNVEAKTQEELETTFGLRTVSAGKDGGKKRIPQSQCRTCRAASTKASKAKKKAEAAQTAK